MINLSDFYKGSFFSKRDQRLAWRVPYVCDAMEEVFHPKTFVDVGCAIGEYVAGMRERGVDAVGIEGSANCLLHLKVDSMYVHIIDLRVPISERIDGKFDVAMCLEVAEHIEPEFANVFIDNLCGLSERVVMSYAPPGQEGHGHFNCQHGSYWIEKFAKCGYLYDEETVHKIRGFWEPVKHRKEMGSYYNHLLAFGR